MTKAALELAYANSAKLKDNIDHIDNNSFEVNQLKDKVSHLDEMKKLRSELEDTQNRGLTKILIFKNILYQQQYHKESWNESNKTISRD